MLETADRQKKNRRNIKVKAPTRRRAKRARGRVAKPMGHLDPRPRRISKAKQAQIQKACERLAHLPARVATRFARRLPAHIELDDLVGAGSVGLVIAVNQHIDKPEEDLERLAKQRIRGAILDHLRGVDHLTRRQRAAVTELNRVKRSLDEQGEGEDESKVALRMGVTVERVRKVQSQLAAVKIAPIETSAQLEASGPSPFQAALGSEDGERLRHAMKQLPDRLQTLLSLYYCESLTYKEIGDVMQISRSRICQLHTQAIGELRQRMMPEAA